MFKWLNLNNVFDTCREWHAFVEGFSDGFCQSKSRYDPWNKGKGEKNLLLGIRKEHHYYNAGRAVGFASLIAFSAGCLTWATRSILLVLKS